MDFLRECFARSTEGGRRGGPAPPAREVPHRGVPELDRVGRPEPRAAPRPPGGARPARDDAHVRASAHAAAPTSPCCAWTAAPCCARRAARSPTPTERPSRPVFALTLLTGAACEVLSHRNRNCRPPRPPHACSFERPGQAARRRRGVRSRARDDARVVARARAPARARQRRGEDRVRSRRHARRARDCRRGGEMDKLALEQAGIKNVVSVPDGAPGESSRTDPCPPPRRIASSSTCGTVARRSIPCLASSSPWTRTRRGRRSRRSWRDSWGRNGASAWPRPGGV